MKRNNPAIALAEVIEEIAERTAKPGVELATVIGVSPTTLSVSGTEIKLDIKMLAGAEYAAGDRVAVQMVDGDYIILGKVVSAL